MFQMISIPSSFQNQLTDAFIYIYIYIYILCVCMHMYSGTVTSEQ